MSKPTTLASIELTGFEGESFELSVNMRWRAICGDHQLGLSNMAGLALAALIQTADQPLSNLEVRQEAEGLYKQATESGAYPFRQGGRLDIGIKSWNNELSSVMAEDILLRRHIFMLGDRNHPSGINLLLADISGYGYGREMIRDFAERQKLDRAELDSLDGAFLTTYRQRFGFAQKHEGLDQSLRLGPKLRISSSRGQGR